MHWSKVFAWVVKDLPPEFLPGNFEKSITLMENSQLRQEEILKLSEKLNTMGFKTYVAYGGRGPEEMLASRSIATNWDPQLYKAIENLGYVIGSKIISRRKGGYLIKHYIFTRSLEDIQMQLLRETRPY